MIETPEESLPQVSVVTPVRNCVEDVQSWVEALRAQTYPADRLEIIIVDNGSSDGTVEQVESLGVTCLRWPEQGRSRALNKGLDHAKGEIICTTDISCRPEPEWIMEVVRSFKDPAVGCVAGEIKLLKTHENIAIGYQERSNYMSPMGARLRNRPPYLPYADGANASFRRAVFDVVGPFEENFIKAADVEICYRMFFLTDYKIAFNPRALVWERGEENLRALLKQRYRIGIGNMLLRARFPDLFVKKQGRSIKGMYWTAREYCVKLLKVLGLAVHSIWQREARAEFADILISDAMSAAQALGRRQGRRYLAATEDVPKPLAVNAIADYVSGCWTVSSRIVGS